MRASYFPKGYSKDRHQTNRSAV